MHMLDCSSVVMSTLMSTPSEMTEMAGKKMAWTTVDELNWKADRAVLRSLKKRGETPSEWLASEYRELSARRKGVMAGTAK